MDRAVHCKICWSFHHAAGVNDVSIRLVDFMVVSLSQNRFFMLFPLTVLKVCNSGTIARPAAGTLVIACAFVFAIALFFELC